MLTTQPTLPYPRRRLQRGLLRALGRMLLPLLTRTQISGSEHFPDHGPLIVVGNHIAMMEVVLMVVYAPWQIELLGADDIPPPPSMAPIVRLHGTIPINRGQVERAALEQALDVLRQGGVVGVFPEGGIWDPGAKPAKPGIAWLSAHGHAPILPIGFGGLEGALNAMLRLKRPRLTMTIGDVLPPVELSRGVPHKVAYQQAAQHVMEIVESLIPPELRPPAPQICDERFTFSATLYDAEGRELPIPAGLEITHGAALSKIFYRPAILRIFARDLHLDVAALQELDRKPPAAQITAALSAMLGYLDERNPYFFDYRFGHEEGQAMARGLRQLHALASWCVEQRCELSAVPTRSYRRPDSDGIVTETHPGQAHSW